MKEIEEEYQEFEVSKLVEEHITNPYYLILNLEDVFKQVRKDQFAILRKICMLRVVAFFIPKLSDVLQEEEKILREMIRLADENLDFFTEITGEINESTFLEYRKLADFIVKHYVGNRSYYDSQLETVHQAYKGIELHDYRQRNTREAICDFVSHKIAETKVQKRLEKKEEM